MKKQKIITCTGYGGTGSSAITDLLKEFVNVHSYGDFEFYFLQEPNGIKDLEYGLLENNNRNYTTYKIKKFMKYIEYLTKSPIYSYSKIFNNKFYKISQEYIESLIQVKWIGYTLSDIKEENYIKKFFYYVERIIQKKILKKTEGGAIFYKNKYPMCYSYLNKEYFYDRTKEYLNNLFLEISKNKEYLALDQLVPPNDINKYLNYFYDIKVIVVDRDPRDVYLLNEIYWKESWIPSKNVKTFIKWYKLLREHQKIELLKENPENILRIKFEDLIFKYDETIREIMCFLNLKEEDHLEKMKYFNPKFSEKNTNLFKKFNSYKNEIELIEKELKEFCYNFR